MAESERTTDWTEDLDSARAGSERALGDLLAGTRNYLLAVAAREWPSGVAPREAVSDVVQQTMLEAYRGFAQFDGRSPAQWRAWMRRILLHNLTDCQRRGLRSAARERAAAMVVGLHLGTGNDLVDPRPTPRQVLIDREAQARVEQALARLLPEFRQAIVLRHQQALTFAELGIVLGRSENAARKLWVRAIKQLRQALSADTQRSAPPHLAPVEVARLAPERPTLVSPI